MAGFDRSKMLQAVGAQNNTYTTGKAYLSTPTLHSRIMKEFHVISLILEKIVHPPESTCPKTRRSHVNRLLEVGCGVGNLTPVLRGMSQEVVALDISEVGIAIAREHYRYLGNVRFLVGDGTRTTQLEAVMEGDFDLIYFREFNI